MNNYYGLKVLTLSRCAPNLTVETTQWEHIRVNNEIREELARKSASNNEG